MSHHDRGALTSLHFRVCARGFMLSSPRGTDPYGIEYAFDRIEDVAAWFVEQYSASVDTHAQRGDGEATAPFMGSAVTPEEAADAQGIKP